MLRRVSKIQPSQSNWNFPDFPPVPLSKPELLKLTMYYLIKLKCITLLDDKDANFHLDRKKKMYFPTHIAGQSSRSLHCVTTHVKPQVAQARNMSIGDKQHCCVTFEI